MRILLADENTDSQLTFRAFMRPTSHVMDVVENGTHATEAFKSRPFDLVLVNMGLPEVDGMALIRMMRGWERHLGVPPIPIVALLRKDRDDGPAALKAGYSAWLMRPVVGRELFECLTTLRWPDPAIAWTGQGEDRRKRIVVKVDPELKALVPAFLEKRRADLAELKAALKAQDFERIRLVGHRLKGKGSGYGFAGISKCGDALEHAASARDMFGLREAIEELKNYLDRLDVVY